MSAADFITRYEKALASQDWDQVAPLMHPNCTVTFSDGSVHAGKAAVEKAFRRNFSLIEDETYKISDVHWVVQTDAIAVFTYSYDWSGIMNGSRVSGEGRGTSSLVKQDEKWLLASEHLGPKATD